MSEVGIVFDRRKLRVNVGKSEVMRYSRFGNGDAKRRTVRGSGLL